MIVPFLKLEWKQYFRSSYWQKSIFLNILLAFFALYFMASFLIIGIGGYYILKDQFPNQEVIQSMRAAVSNGLGFYDFDKNLKQTK